MQFSGQKLGLGRRAKSAGQCRPYLAEPRVILEIPPPPVDLGVGRRIILWIGDQERLQQFDRFVLIPQENTNVGLEPGQFAQGIEVRSGASRQRWQR